MVVVCSMVGAVLVARVSGHPAIELVDAVWNHIGGKKNYEKCRFIEFTFQVVDGGKVATTRKHKWDRYEENYVVEYTDRKTGDEYKVYLNIDTRDGVAFKNGSKVTGPESADLLKHAYAIFCNDTFWLLAPTKLQAPGARVQYVGHTGEKESDGSEGEFVVIHLWFEGNVGVTPGDQYWLNITHDGRIDSWRYVLQDGTKGEWQWVDEKDCGMGIILSTRKVSGDRAITFPDVKFSADADPSLFVPPAGS